MVIFFFSVSVVLALHADRFSVPVCGIFGSAFSKIKFSCLLIGWFFILSEPYKKGQVVQKCCLYSLMIHNVWYNVANLLNQKPQQIWNYDFSGSLTLFFLITQSKMIIFQSDRKNLVIFLDGKSLEYNCAQLRMEKGL